MKRNWVFAIMVIIFLGATSDILVHWLVKMKPASAQAEQRYETESLGITRGHYLVADLGSFPDGATKLILRDPQGRIGLVLAVYDRPGYQRAQIEFYDTKGNVVRTLDASPVTSSESSEGKVPYSLKPSDVQYIQNQIDNLRKEIADIRRLVTE